MKNTFDVSVVIPCFNCEATIETCIHSVLLQTVGVREIIVVDDGSSDSTPIVLNKLRDRVTDTGVKFVKIYQENAGPSKARNEGILQASGTWIAFLDSDDFWAVDKLEKQMKFVLADDEIVLSGCGYGKDRFPNFETLTVISFKMLCNTNFYATPSVIVKKDIIASIGFNEQQKYSEDYRTWLLICAKYKCIYLKEVLCSNIEQKQSFGDKGLSSNLWKMQKGELSNYFALSQLGHLHLGEVVYFSSRSLLKFLRRVLLTAARQR